MGLFDDYSNGVGSPRPKWGHQKVLGRLYANMYSELCRKGYEPLTEATVTDDWDDLAPDLVVFGAHYEPLAIIDYEKGILFGYDANADEWISSEGYEISSRYLCRPLTDYLS